MNMCAVEIQGQNIDLTKQIQILQNNRIDLEKKISTLVEKNQRLEELLSKYREKIFIPEENIQNKVGYFSLIFF